MGDQIDIQITCDRIEDVEKVFEIFRQNKKGYRSITPRPPTQDGYQSLEETIRVAVEILGNFPWDAVVDEIVAFLTGLFLNFIKEFLSDNEALTVKVAEKTFTITSKEDISQIERYLRKEYKRRN